MSQGYLALRDWEALAGLSGKELGPLGDQCGGRTTPLSRPVYKAGAEGTHRSSPPPALMEVSSCCRSSPTVGRKLSTRRPAPALPRWTSRPEEHCCLERLCRKDSDFSSPAVESIKNRMDSKLFYSLLQLLASFLLADGPAQTGERQQSHGLKILWQFKYW